MRMHGRRTDALRKPLYPPDRGSTSLQESPLRNVWASGPETSRTERCGRGAIRRVVCSAAVAAEEKHRVECFASVMKIAVARVGEIQVCIRGRMRRDWSVPRVTRGYLDYAAQGGVGTPRFEPFLPNPNPRVLSLLLSCTTT